MSSQDFFFYALGTGFLVLVGFLAYAAIDLSKTLKKLTSILAKVDDIASDADTLKNYIKYAILYLKDLVVKKRGDKNDK